METQEILESYARNLGRQMKDVTDEITEAYKSHIGNEYFGDDTKALIGFNAMCIANEITDDLNDDDEAEFFSRYADISDDEDLKNYVDGTFDRTVPWGQHIYEIPRDVYENLVDRYKKTFGVFYEKYNDRIIDLPDYYTPATPETPVYLVTEYAIDAEGNSMDLISNLNRVLFLGYDQFDSIHQPEFNICAMYKFVELQNDPETLAEGND